MDKVEVADEFDDEPLIEDVPEDEESLNKLYKSFRESFISRESSRRPSFILMKSEANLFSMYQTNAIQAGNSRQNPFDRTDTISNYSEAPSMKTSRIKTGHMMKCFDSMFGGHRTMRSTIKKEGTFIVTPDKQEFNQTLPSSRLDEKDAV